jgi:signal peptidase I
MTDDVRARLEAQVAARRQAGGPDGSSSRSSRRRPSTPGNHLLRLTLRLGFVILAAAAFAFGLREWVVQPFWIPSQSMEPTLHGCPTCRPDRLLVDKLSYHFHSVNRGDIVVFTRPSSVPTTDANLVKRVIGRAGETVRAVNGTVYVDNRALTEPYVAAACHGTRDFGPTVVPKGDVFVMGDNRCDSLDSRSFGPIATSTIVGRAFITVWPLARLHWL